MKQIGSDDARRDFRALLNDVEHQGEHVTILRYQDPAAVVVPVQWYQTMQALQRGVHAFTHDTDGGWLPGESNLPVGELLAAIGAAAIGELEAVPDGPA